MTGARFTGNRLLILGGSCELAICLAEVAMQEGLFPVLTWRSEEGKLRIETRLQAFSGKYATAPFELGNRTALDALFEPTGVDFDYLVDFAQGNMESLIGSAAPDEIERYFSENVSFRAEVLRKASRAMLKKRRGRLIFISSSAACKPNPGQGFYSAAKLACEALYRNLGIELASRGITTMSLRPGYVDTGRGKKYLQTHQKEAMERVPTRKPLTCREVAEAILFFLSDHGSGFNATEVAMDGGLTAGK
jgi:3-oxoacyl-[acyl-carrier protein] reductase